MEAEEHPSQFLRSHDESAGEGANGVGVELDGGDDHEEVVRHWEEGIQSEDRHAVEDGIADGEIGLV